MDDVRFRRGRQKVIHRAAFVGFYVGKSDPTQFFERDHGSHGRRYFGEHVAKAGVNEERLLAVYQELIKRFLFPRAILSRHRYMLSGIPHAGRQFAAGLPPSG